MKIFLLIVTGLVLSSQPMMADPPFVPPVTCISLSQELAVAEAELSRLEMELFECQLEQNDCTYLELAVQVQKIVIEQIKAQMTEMECFPA